MVDKTGERLDGGMVAVRYSRSQKQLIEDAAKDLALSPVAWVRSVTVQAARTQLTNPPQLLVERGEAA